MNNTVYEIDLIDDYGNIFSYQYIHNCNGSAEEYESIINHAKEYQKQTKKAWNKNLYYKILKLK